MITEAVTVGRACNFPVTALSFVKIEGTRQTLSSPYTGLLPIFAIEAAFSRCTLVGGDMKVFIG